MDRPLRILHVVTIMNLGGIENYLMSLYRNIDRSKVQFDFLVHRVDKGYHDDEIKALGGRIFYIQPLHPATHQSYLKKIRDVFKVTEYDFVHAHMNATSYEVLKMAKIMGVPHLIAHSHTSQSTINWKAAVRFVHKKLLNTLPIYRMACSNQAGEWLFGHKTKFQVMPTAVDVEDYQFNLQWRDQIREELGISATDVVIGNVAQFKYMKNHEFMLEVFAFYYAKCSNSYLMLVGDGALRSKIERSAKEKGIFNKVIFVGQQSHIQHYLNAMDLFLFPSAYEGFGIAALEAQVNGIPVLIADQLPSELRMTPLVHTLPLSKGAKYWAEHINQILKFAGERKDCTLEIIKKGYEIKNAAMQLQDFYLNKASNFPINQLAFDY